jgi:hypothetical protein
MTMNMILLAGVVFLACGPDPEEFLQKAVTEGLKEDGADPIFIKDRISERHDLFVLKCPICEPVKRSFARYASGPVPAKAGKGLPKDIVDDLKNPARVVQLKAVERLVDRYVSSHYERLKMSPEARRTLQAKLEEMKKEGMRMVELGGQKGFDFCPSCSGAAKAK